MIMFYGQNLLYLNRREVLGKLLYRLDEMMNYDYVILIII